MMAARMPIVVATRPMYPRVRPARAIPPPVKAPCDCLIFDRATCPQITAGIPAKRPKQRKLSIPKTRLQIAWALVFAALITSFTLTAIKEKLIFYIPEFCMSRRLSYSH
jgi:hypothetical protein